MSDFLQYVLDMGVIHPAIYSDLQVASDGSFMSTEEANRLTFLDFSGIGFDKDSLEFDMDSAYAPFGASPSFAYGALDSEPFSIDGNLLGDLSIPPSSSGAANTVHEDLVAHIPSPPPIKRGFGNDLSNIERSTADLLPLVSSSSSSSSSSTSSGVSTAKMATPTDLPSPISAPAPSLSPSSPSSLSPPSSPSSGVSTPEVATPADMPSPVSVPTPPPFSPISAPTPSSSSETPSPSSPAAAPVHSSSSPAGKSSKQRRNAAPSARPPNRSSPSRPRNAPIVPAHHKVICSVEGCTRGFGDRTAMLRHVMSRHIKQRHQCHGCPKSFTRPDALVRHLNKSVLGSECRLAAMENGWEQVVGEKGIQMRSTERTDRIKIVADFLS